MNDTPENKIPVIAVVGATASGKTALAVEICRRFNGEVVSADSMQIYKGMSVATAKPTPEEMRGIKHHLIDFLPVTEKYSVARYIADASAAVADIVSRSKTPVVAGGTGLYADSLLQGVVFEDEPDTAEVRQALRLRREKEGIDSLYAELEKIDPETAESLHINNEGRVLRALEVYYLTGEKPSERRIRSRQTESPFLPLYISIEYKDREKLYEKINKRVDNMVANGLIDEARGYFALDNACTASAAIGYKELAPYFDGVITLPEALENLKRATRRYAKRQLTWYRNKEGIHRIYADELPEGVSAADEAEKIITESGLFNR